MDFTESYLDTCSSVALTARTGDLIGLQELIWNGRPVDVKDNRGWTPLHEAAYHGNSGCLDFLLRQDNVCVDWQTFEGETALVFAARQGHKACIHTLLCDNADVNLAANEGYTALWEAVNIGRLDCVKMLIKEHANIDCVVYTGYRPVHVACEKGYPHILHTLLQHDVQIDVYTEHHLSPLFLAAHTGHLDCLKLILTEINDSEIDLVNVPAFDNATPLLIAAQEGHVECLRLLLACGADANIPITENGAVPLQYAVYKGHFKCVEDLLPVTNIQPIQEKLSELHPLIKALHLPDTKILQLLVLNGFDPHITFPLHSDQSDMDRLTSIFSPLTHGSILCQLNSDCPLAGVKMLLDSGLSPDSRHIKEMPPLMCALWNRNCALADLLLQSGANPNIYLKNNDGNLAMILALRAGLQSDELEDNVTDKGLFVWTLLMAGAEAESLFHIVSSDCGGINPATDSLLFQFLRKSPYQTVLFLVSLLLCFCHNVVLDKAIVEIFTGEDLKNIQSLQESTHRLSHLVRTRIVKNLGSKGRYTEPSIQSLLLPRTVTDFLLFKEYGNLGNCILELNTKGTRYR